MAGASSGGTGILTILLVVFVVLKLVGVIAWSWWWVLSPLWISFIVLGGVLVFALLAFIFYVLTDK